MAIEFYQMRRLKLYILKHLEDDVISLKAVTVCNGKNLNCSINGFRRRVGDGGSVPTIQKFEGISTPSPENAKCICNAYVCMSHYRSPSSGMIGEMHGDLIASNVSQYS